MGEVNVLRYSAVVLSLLLLVGCAVATQTPSDQGPKTRQLDHVASKRISRERAIEIAKGVDRKAEWDVAFNEAYQYESNGEARNRPVWVAQTLRPAPNTTLWIDAETEEILTVRQSEAPSPTGKRDSSSTVVSTGTVEIAPQVRITWALTRDPQAELEAGGTLVVKNADGSVLLRKSGVLE